MSRSDPSEIGHVGDGPHWESFVNQTVVDEHVRHAKHRNSKTLLRVNTLISESHGVIFVGQNSFAIPSN